MSAKVRAASGREENRLQAQAAEVFAEQLTGDDRGDATRRIVSESVKVPSA